MKLLSKVVWAEGMYLAPHHFQAQNRYFEDSLHFAASSLWNESYGLIALQIDPDALRNGTVALLHARGIFEDGLAFDLPECDPPPEPFSFSDHFSPSGDHLTIQLAVPRWNADGQNCSIDGDASRVPSRYVSSVHVKHDDNTGSDEKPVSLGRKNLSLMLESESADQFVTLPIVRIIRDGMGNFVSDPTFIPPCLKVSASDRLLSLLQRLVEILDEKSDIISREQSQPQGKFQAGLSARHVSQFWFLHAINSGATALRHILLTKHSHPEELFRDLSRLGGALCTFGLDTHPRSLPVYNHREPERCFDELDKHIRRHLDILAPPQTIVIPLKEFQKYFYGAEIQDQRCLGKARWILSIRSSIGEADLISRTLHLAKVCSAKFVPELVKRAVPGLALTHLEVPPADVRARVETQYYGISRTGPCWEHIQNTRQVGVYVPGEVPSPEMELIVILDG
jgi:type VI secretion system protein ImpJ